MGEATETGGKKENILTGRSAPVPGTGKQPRHRSTCPLAVLSPGSGKSSHPSMLPRFRASSSREKMLAVTNAKQLEGKHPDARDSARSACVPLPFFLGRASIDNSSLSKSRSWVGGNLWTALRTVVRYAAPISRASKLTCKLAGAVGKDSCEKARRNGN